MHAIIEKGLRIPEDISVTGFDDIKSSSYLQKPLTTVAVPISELGKISAEALLKKVMNKGHEVIQHVMLKPRLIVRETTTTVHNK
jgi:DNA-binding LacI/PurR family transcriptional regulator